MVDVNPYDIEHVFERIEEELIASMMRNLAKHKAEEDELGINWSAWQSDQLQALEAYRKKNVAKYPKQFAKVNQQIDALLRKTYGDSQTKQEVEILRAAKAGMRVAEGAGALNSTFFKLNERKLGVLIKSVTNDFEKAEVAVLRRADDQYRKIIYAAQVYANTGAGSYEKAVDMATKDFLTKGIDCIEYKNGSRHSIKEYSRMAIRTANKRAQLHAEGDKRKEWGISTVIVHKRNGACPKCLPFVGKVFVDDVWSGGVANDKGNTGKSSVTGVQYPLLSTAIAAGLYHPNCKDGHSTYYEGISEPPDGRYSKKELQDLEEKYRKEQRAQYAKRQAEKYERLSKYSLASENQEKYQVRAEQWRKCLDVDNPVVKEPEIDIIKTSLTKQLDQLTDEEKSTITEYSGFLAQQLNSALQLSRPLGDKLQKKKEILETALAKGVVPENITVIRKTIPEFMNAFPKGYKYTPVDLKKLKGKTLTNNSFMSTSLVEFPYPGRNVVLRLHVPRGYQGVLYIKELALPKYKNQEEVLFDIGTKYRILSVTIKDGIYYMEAEIV